MSNGGKEGVVNIQTWSTLVPAFSQPGSSWKSMITRTNMRIFCLCPKYEKCEQQYVQDIAQENNCDDVDIRKELPNGAEDAKTFENKSHTQKDFFL